MVGPRFVHTPYYAVSDTVIVDAYFVRPGFCHFYFGDYYGPRYAAIGFECGYHYSRRHYDAVVVYSRWEYRNSPGWYDSRISVTVERNAGRAPLPPRTLIQQNNITIVNNKTTNIYKTAVLAPAKTVVATRGAKTVPLDTTARLQVKQSATTFQKAAVTERLKTESVPHGTTPPAKPRTAALNVPQHSGAPHVAAGAGSGLKTPLAPVTTTLPKNPERKGVTVAQPLTSKGPAALDPIKAKSPDGTTPAAAPADGGRPMVTRPPDRPAPTKRPTEEKKKKGG